MNIKNSLSQPIEEWSILADRYEDIMYDNVVDIIRNTIIPFKEKFKDKQPSYVYSWSHRINPTDSSYIEKEIFNLLPKRFSNGDYIPYYMSNIHIKEYSSEDDAWEALLIAWIEYEALHSARM